MGVLPSMIGSYESKKEQERAVFHVALRVESPVFSCIVEKGIYPQAIFQDHVRFNVLARFSIFFGVLKCLRLASLDIEFVKRKVCQARRR